MGNCTASGSPFPLAQAIDPAVKIRHIFAYNVPVFDPDAHMPRINRGMVYLGACLIAGIRLARQSQVNVRVLPTRTAIAESVDLAHEIYNRIFRKVPEKLG